jgi:hypothetical protein
MSGFQLSDGRLCLPPIVARQRAGLAKAGRELAPTARALRSRGYISRHRSPKVAKSHPRSDLM